MKQEGQKPCQIITPQLDVGNIKMKRDASNGNTDVLINGREITKAELWMLQVAVYYTNKLTAGFKSIPTLSNPLS